MPRRRLGAVLLLSGPVATEVDGLRRACGDRALARVPSHITLVPPVNVRTEDLPAALTRMRTAAGAVRGPLEVTIGPPATFLPATPVLHLEVGGHDLNHLHRLRDAVFAYPLERSLTWPFVPHVTLADGAEPERILAARLALADFTVSTTFDRIHLLEEGGERRWHPIADCPLGPVDLVGRGGFEVELTTSDLLDPEAERFLAEHGTAPGGPPYVVARHRWTVIGVAFAAATLVDPAHVPHGVAELLARRLATATAPI